MSCPFYGCALWDGAHQLIDMGGNRCALITSAHSPCKMEIQGARPAWIKCDRNPENNGTGYDAVITREMPRAEALERFPGAFDAQESEP